MEFFEDIGKSLTLKDKVLESLKRQIIIGNLKHGSRLREEVLSKAMNVSRAPIREAFNQLESEGFVKIIPRKGVIVSPISRQNIEDVFELRINLESLALTKSFGKIEMAEIEKLENNLKKFIDKPATEKNRIEYLELDKLFHFLLVKECGNQRLIEILEKLQDQIHWFRSISIRNISFKDSVGGHLAIVEAIRKNNCQLAIERLNEHLLRAKSLTLDTNLEGMSD